MQSGSPHAACDSCDDSSLLMGVVPLRASQSAVPVSICGRRHDETWPLQSPVPQASGNLAHSVLATSVGHQLITIVDAH